MKTPQYKDSSKLVPLCLFMDSVTEAFWNYGGSGFIGRNNLIRLKCFDTYFQKAVTHKKIITEINLN